MLNKKKNPCLNWSALMQWSGEDVHCCFNGSVSPPPSAIFPKLSKQKISKAICATVSGWHRQGSRKWTQCHHVRSKLSKKLRRRAYCVTSDVMVSDWPARRCKGHRFVTSIRSSFALLWRLWSLCGTSAAMERQLARGVKMLRLCCGLSDLVKRRREPCV